MWGRGTLLVGIAAATAALSAGCTPTKDVTGQQGEGAPAVQAAAQVAPSPTVGANAAAGGPAGGVVDQASTASEAAQAQQTLSTNADAVRRSWQTQLEVHEATTDFAVQATHAFYELAKREGIQLQQVGARDHKVVEDDGRYVVDDACELGYCERQASIGVKDYDAVGWRVSYLKPGEDTDCYLDEHYSHKDPTFGCRCKFTFIRAAVVAPCKSVLEAASAERLKLQLNRAAEADLIAAMKRKAAAGEY